MSAIVSNPRFSVKQHIGISVILAVLLTAFTYFVGQQMSWITELNWIEVAAVLTSYSCTYLFVVQTRFAYVIAVASTALWAYFFWDANLLGSMAQNLYLIPTVIYGWYIWGRDDQTKPIQHVKLSQLPIYFVVTAFVYGVIAWTIGKLGGELAQYDAMILVGSVLAQFLLDRKKIETWLVWIAVDILAVWFYASQGFALTSFQFVFFLLNAIWGFYLWRKEMIHNRNLKYIDDFVGGLFEEPTPVASPTKVVSALERQRPRADMHTLQPKPKPSPVRHTPRSYPAKKRDDDTDIVTPIVIASTVDSYSDAPSNYNAPTETYSGHGGSFGGGGASASYDSSSSSSSYDSGSSDSGSSSSDSSSSF